MARVRIFEYGPSVRTPRDPGRITTSDLRDHIRTRDGVILRARVGFSRERTTKSVLRPKVHKGLEPPGIQPKNYPSAAN